MRFPRALVTLLCAALATALAATAIVVLTDEHGQRARAGSGTHAPSGEITVDRHLALSPVVPRPGDEGSGTAFVVRRGRGGRLGIVVRARLPTNPRGELYEAWLYNSVTDARPLGEPAMTTGGLLQATGPLPRDYSRRWRYVDVSRERASGGEETAAVNENHSGESVLRGDLRR